LDLTNGLAAGTFIQPARNAPTWTQKPDGMGHVVRMYNRDHSGSLTLLIDMESREHQELVTIANVDLISRAIIGPMVIKDDNTKEVAFYDRAYIATIPDIPKGLTSGVIPWVFNYQRSIQQPGVTKDPTFNANVVGN
jgi:hypothetical protein